MEDNGGRNTAKWDGRMTSGTMDDVENKQIFLAKKSN